MLSIFVSMSKPLLTPKRCGVILDFDKDGQVVGVEFLGIRARTSEQELASLNFETI